MEKKQIDYASLNQERVISIADLIKEIFRRLWLVILAAVIFAALLGGYKYVKDMKAAANIESTDSTEKISDELSDEDAKEVNNVLWVQENLIQQQEYAENSILMKINPYDESNVTMLYHLENIVDEEEEGSRSLVDAYDSYINNGALTADLKEKGVELDAQYISELISCEITTNMVSDATTGSLALDNGNSFNITIIHINEEECLALADKITECLQEYQSVLQKSISAHTLKLVEQSYSEVVDRSLWTYKLDRTNSIVTMQDKVEELKANLSSEQLAVIDKYTEKGANALQKEDSQGTEETKTVHVSISKKYVLMGAVIGIVLACLFIIVCYVLSGAIQKADDLQYIYNLRILGELKGKRGKNIFRAFGNRLIGRKEVNLSPEEEQALLVSNIHVSCEKQGIKKLLLAGSRNISVDQSRIDSIISELKKSDIDAEYIEDILYSAEAFDKMATGCDSMVLFEKIKQSRYEEVSKEICACMEQNVQILGAVVLS